MRGTGPMMQCKAGWRVSAVPLRLAAAAMSGGIVGACSGGAPEVPGNVTVVEAPDRSKTVPRWQRVSPPPPASSPMDLGRVSNQPSSDFADPPLPPELQENAGELAPLPRRPDVIGTGSPPASETHRT